MSELHFRGVFLAVAFLLLSFYSVSLRKEAQSELFGVIAVLALIAAFILSLCTILVTSANPAG